jgi:hypothetical protein
MANIDTEEKYFSYEDLTLPGGLVNAGTMYAAAETWSVGAQIFGFLGVGCVAAGVLLEKSGRRSGAVLRKVGFVQLAGAALMGLESFELREKATQLDELSRDKSNYSSVRVC